MANINPNTPIWQLTVREFQELLKNNNGEHSAVRDYSTQNIVHGLGGIAKHFGTSITTVQEWKRSGKYNDAITQEGRKIICDTVKMTRIMAKND